MECEFWKDVVAKLRDLCQCNWATHVLSSGLLIPGETAQENLLQQALRCVPAKEMIEGVIYSYRDWSTQPYCDLILAQFNADVILSVFLLIERPEANMKLGILGFMDETDRKKAVRLAMMFNTPNESPDVMDAVRYSLRPD